MNRKSIILCLSSCLYRTSNYSDSRSRTLRVLIFTHAFDSVKFGDSLLWMVVELGRGPSATGRHGAGATTTLSKYSHPNYTHQSLSLSLKLLSIIKNWPLTLQIPRFFQSRAISTVLYISSLFTSKCRERIDLLGSTNAYQTLCSIFFFNLKFQNYPLQVVNSSCDPNPRIYPS